MLDQSITLPVKRCPRCGEVKDLASQFFLLGGTQKSQAARYRPHCKACHNRDRSDWPWSLRITDLRKLGPAPSVAELRDGLGEPYECYLCGDGLTWDVASIDHVLPVSRGGTNAVQNLRWSHRQCNRVKSDLLLDEFYALVWKIAQRHPELS